MWISKISTEQVFFFFNLCSSAVILGVEKTDMPVETRGHDMVREILIKLIKHIVMEKIWCCELQIRLVKRFHVYYHKYSLFSDFRNNIFFLFDGQNQCQAMVKQF